MRVDGTRSLRGRLELEQSLGRRFESAYWCAELQTYALALDGAKKAMPRPHINAGQSCSPDCFGPNAPARAKDLLGPHFSRAGHSPRCVRAIANNPMSYHKARSAHMTTAHRPRLRSLQCNRRCRAAVTALFEAASYMEFRRLPELFCGLPARQRSRTHALSSRLLGRRLGQARLRCVACSLAGLEFDPQAGEIRMRKSASARFSRRSSNPRTEVRRGRSRCPKFRSS